MSATYARHGREGNGYGRRPYGARGGFVPPRRNAKIERKVPEHLIGSSIFASDSPKAYAPIAYSIPSDAPVITPEDFALDEQLPTYPSIPPREIDKPLGATFIDTESERPNFSGLSRPLIKKKDVNSKVKDIIESLLTDYSKNPLRLGDEEIPYPQPLISSNVQKAPTILQKRGRESTAEHEEEHSPIVKKRREVRMKFDGEEDINNDTVKPENVLRMVDSSLVDSPDNQKSRETYRGRPGSSYHPRGKPYSAPYTNPPAPAPIPPEEAFNGYRNQYPVPPPPSRPQGFDDESRYRDFYPARGAPYSGAPVQGRQYDYNYSSPSGRRRRRDDSGPIPQEAPHRYGDYPDPRSAFYGPDYEDYRYSNSEDVYRGRYDDRYRR